MIDAYHDLVARIASHHSWAVMWEAPVQPEARRLWRQAATAFARDVLPTLLPGAWTARTYRKGPLQDLEGRRRHILLGHVWTFRTRRLECYAYLTIPYPRPDLPHHESMVTFRHLSRESLTLVAVTLDPALSFHLRGRTLAFLVADPALLRDRAVVLDDS
jgi:hypothetical protein